MIRQFNKKKHDKSKFVQKDQLFFIAISSAAAGALLGILFAPDKGEKTRKNLVKKGDTYLSEMKKRSEELIQQLKSNADSILEKSKETVQNIKQDAEHYSEWTFQELYDRAKELKIKGYSQMNKSGLVQALEDL